MEMWGLNGKKECVPPTYLTHFLKGFSKLNPICCGLNTRALLYIIVNTVNDNAVCMLGEAVWCGEDRAGGQERILYIIVNTVNDNAVCMLGEAVWCGEDRAGGQERILHYQHNTTGTSIVSLIAYVLIKDCTNWRQKINFNFLSQCLLV